MVFTKVFYVLFVSFEYKLNDCAELWFRQYVDRTWEFRIFRKVDVLVVSYFYNDLVSDHLVDSCVIFEVVTSEAWFIQSYLLNLSDVTSVSNSLAISLLAVSSIRVIFLAPFTTPPR